MRIEDVNISLEWNQCSTYTLDSESNNCGMCTKCGGWTTDREVPNPIHGISSGVKVDGEIICDECLNFI